MSYRNNLQSAKVSSYEDSPVGEWREDLVIESKDGDIVCLNYRI